MRVSFIPQEKGNKAWRTLLSKAAYKKKLLSTTNWSLTAIAHAVGCASESHLALHFKRLTGLTPKQYQ